MDFTRPSFRKIILVDTKYHKQARFNNPRSMACPDPSRLPPSPIFRHAPALLSASLTPMFRVSTWLSLPIGLVVMYLGTATIKDRQRQTDSGAPKQLRIELNHKRPEIGRRLLLTLT